LQITPGWDERETTFRGTWVARNAVLAPLFESTYDIPGYVIGGYGSARRMNLWFSLPLSVWLA
jgi:hypothetical protein